MNSLGAILLQSSAGSHESARSSEFVRVAEILRQPLFGYSWELRLPHDLDPTGEVAKLAVTVDWPGLSVEVDDQIPWLPNFTVGVATGWAGGNQIMITFIENEELMVTKFLERWFDKMFYSNSELYPPKNYWRDVELVLLGTRNKPVTYLIATHAFPLSYYKFTVDYAGNDVVKIEVPLHYANVERR